MRSPGPRACAQYDPQVLPVEIQGPSRRGGSSAVTRALLGRGCWQLGSQCRWPAPAIPAASEVRAAKQTDPGQRSGHTLVL